MPINPQIGYMLVRLLDRFAANIGLAALLISAALLILISNRDAFELDSKPRIEEDPTGGSRLVPQWKYLSDPAESARLELLDLVKLLRLASTTMLGLAVVLFLAGGAVGVLDYAKFHGLELWCRENPYIRLVYEHGFGLVVLLFGPFMIYRLARVVANIVRARGIPGANKPRGWTPF
jgi:hypothetical protein